MVHIIVQVTPDFIMVSAVGWQEFWEPEVRESHDLRGQVRSEMIEMLCHLSSVNCCVI